MGVILWCLSTVGEEWQSADTLTSLCTDRDDSVSKAPRNPAARMFARHILDRLRWFGLIECRLPLEIFDARCWRKTPLFQRFLSFDVRLSLLAIYLQTSTTAGVWAIVMSAKDAP